MDTTARISGKLLKEAGEALYGPRWKALLSRDLGISANTLRRWQHYDTLPLAFTEPLSMLCQERAAWLDDIAGRLAR